MCHHRELHTTSQREFLCVANPVGTLRLVSTQLFQDLISFYLLESVVRNRVQVCFGYLWEDLANSTADMVFVLRCGDSSTLQTLSLLVICNAPFKVGCTICVPSADSPQSTILTVSVAELLAGEFDDFQRKMMTDAVNMSRDLLRVKESFATWFGLQLLTRPGLAPHNCAHRYDVDGKISLSTLLLAPFRYVRMSNGDVSETRRRLVTVGKLRRC